MSTKNIKTKWTSSPLETITYYPGTVIVIIMGSLKDKYLSHCFNERSISGTMMLKTQEETLSNPSNTTHLVHYLSYYICVHLRYPYFDPGIKLFRISDKPYQCSCPCCKNPKEYRMCSFCFARICYRPQMLSFHLLMQLSSQPNFLLSIRSGCNWKNQPC